MPTDNPAARQPGERFKNWLERVLPALHERLNEMNDNIAGLSADVDTLATVIPELADDITATHAELTEKEAELQASIAQEGEDKELIAKQEGELAQVTAIKERLDPVVEQVQSLVPGPTAGGDGEPPASGGGDGEPPLPPPDGGEGGTAPAGAGEGGV